MFISIGDKIQLPLALLDIEAEEGVRSLGQDPGGGALEWQEGVSGSSMDTQKAP